MGELNIETAFRWAQIPDLIASLQIGAAAALPLGQAMRRRDFVTGIARAIGSGWAFDRDESRVGQAVMRNTSSEVRLRNPRLTKGAIALSNEKERENLQRSGMVILSEVSLWQSSKF